MRHLLRSLHCIARAGLAEIISSHFAFELIFCTLLLSHCASAPPSPILLGVISATFAPAASSFHHFQCLNLCQHGLPKACSARTGERVSRMDSMQARASHRAPFIAAAPVSHAACCLPVAAAVSLLLCSSQPVMVGGAVAIVAVIAVFETMQDRKERAAKAAEQAKFEQEEAAQWNAYVLQQEQKKKAEALRAAAGR